MTTNTSQSNYNNQPSLPFQLLQQEENNNTLPNHLSTSNAIQNFLANNEIQLIPNQSSNTNDSTHQPNEFISLSALPSSSSPSSTCSSSSSSSSLSSVSSSMSSAAAAAVVAAAIAHSQQQHQQQHQQNARNNNNHHHHTNNQHNNNESRFSAANPLLAEKLQSPSLSDLDGLTIGCRTGRPPDLKGEYTILLYNSILICFFIELSCYYITLVCIRAHGSYFRRYNI